MGLGVVAACTPTVGASVEPWTTLRSTASEAADSSPAKVTSVKATAAASLAEVSNWAGLTTPEATATVLEPAPRLMPGNDLMGLALLVESGPATSTVRSTPDGTVRYGDAVRNAKLSSTRTVLA